MACGIRIGNMQTGIILFTGPFLREATALDGALFKKLLGAPR